MIATKDQCLAIYLLCFYISSTTSDLIRTLSHGGKVRGFLRELKIDETPHNIETYLGIPFAVPPIGVRRFAAPEPHAGWSGIRNATTFPPTCWQYLPSEFDLNNAAAKMWLNNTEMNEDCLYLNIWNPVKGDLKLPVMVWIYGGGFTTGSSTLDVYDGAILAATQNVVVLSMQYRVGAFGFLRIDPDAGTTHKLRNGVPDVQTVALGNQGLFDQLLALEWTHSNIAAFGGDPNHVTIFGESAGAVSASILWLSPLAQKYFRRAILQSGSVYVRWGLSEASEANKRGSEFAVACGCKPPSINREASIKCLQSLDPITLINNLDSIASAIGELRREMLITALHEEPQVSDSELLNWATSSRIYFEVPLLPVIDGYMLPSHPDVLMRKQHSTRLKQAPELLIGVNKNEAMYFLLYGLGLINSQFIHPNGTVELPEGVLLAGKRKPIGEPPTLADFHRITAAQLLESRYLLQGITQLPSLFYGLPVLTNSTMSYAAPELTQMSGEELMLRLDSFSGDVDFVCPTLNFAEKAAKFENSKVYLYQFVRRTAGSTMPEWTGVMHGYELEYVFGMPHSKSFQEQFYKFNQEEKQLSDLMMKMWANFAKRGDPNINDDGTMINVRWPEYQSNVKTIQSERDYLILGTKLQASKNLKFDECRFWLHEMYELSTAPRKICDGNKENSGSKQSKGNRIFTLTVTWTTLLFYAMDRSL